MTDFSDLHGELRAVAADLLAKDVSWPRLVDAGWTGLEVPEVLGGAGAGFYETAVILEELGRAAAHTGYLGGAVLSTGALLGVQPSPVRDELLRSVAEGPETVTTVLSPDHQNAGLIAAFTVEQASSGWRVHGCSAFVPDADSPVLLVLAVCSSGEPVIVVLPSDAAGVTATPRPLVDQTRQLSDIVADDVTVEPAALLRFIGEPHAHLGLVAARAQTAVALDSLGVGEAMLARTVSYVGFREQFGRPIGSFQAVKHACANMLVQLTVARRLVHDAVAAVATGNPEATTAAAKAKAFATEMAVEIAGTAMQLHGGIGYTWESGVHIYLKRATLNRALFGTPAAHRQRIAERYRS